MRERIATQFENNGRFILEDFSSFKDWNDVWTCVDDLISIVETLIEDDDDACEKRNALNHFRCVANEAVRTQRNLHNH